MRYSDIYRAFKPVEPAPGLFCPELLSYVRKAKATYSGLLRQHPLSFSAFRQAPWHHYPILALEQTQVTVRTPFLDNDFVRTVFRAPSSASANNDLRVRLIGDGNPALRRIRTDRGFGGRPGQILAAASQGVPRVHVQGRIRLRLRYASMVGADRSSTLTAPARTPIPRQAQVVTFPGLVPRCPFRVCSANTARPTDAVPALHRTQRA